MPPRSAFRTKAPPPPFSRLPRAGAQPRAHPRRAAKPVRACPVFDPLLADLFTETLNGRTALRAVPLMLAVLCALAIAYRYYSAFLAARVAALDDSRPTPAHRFYDGQN